MRRFFLYIFLFLMTSQIAVAQTGEDPELDSLINLYHAIDDDDTAKLNVCEDIAVLHFNVDSTFMWANRLIALGNRHDNALRISRGYDLLSWAYFYMGEYKEANRCSFIAYRIADSLGDVDRMGHDLQQIGFNYTYMDALDRANKYYMEAIKIYRKLNDTANISLSLRAVAENCCHQKMFEKSDSLLRICVYLDSLRADSASLSSDYLSYGVIYNARYRSLSYDQDFSDLLNYKKYIQLSMQYGCNNYYEYSRQLYGLLEAMPQEVEHYKYGPSRRQEVLDSMRTLIAEGYEVVRLTGERSARVDFDFARADYYMLANDSRKAKNLLDSLSTVIEENPSELESKVPILDLKYDSYFRSIDDYKNAYKYKTLYLQGINKLSDMQYAYSVGQTLAQDEFALDIENLQSDKERLERESSKRRRNLIGWIVGSLLVIAYIVLVYFRVRKTNLQLHKNNLMLQMQKEEIEYQSAIVAERNEQITNKNKQITDSIHYASLIQQAVLPTDEQMKDLFREFFVIYRPLHIVAGDFYWASTIGKYHVLVCADCTGHGVPGAFVSMLGVSLLNEVAANINADLSASQILDELRAKLMKSLSQDKSIYERGGRVNMDGMDLSMVMIDYEGMTLQYAGAYRPLWLWRNGSVTEYKPDKMPIGIYLGKERVFTNHVIELMPGDAIYMFSDGITDQFGYTDDTYTSCKHFSTKRLLNLVSEIGGRPMSTQKSDIENAVDTWKNGYKQLDDNIMIGVRI